MKKYTIPDLNKLKQQFFDEQIRRKERDATMRLSVGYFLEWLKNKQTK